MKIFLKQLVDEFKQELIEAFNKAIKDADHVNENELKSTALTSYLEWETNSYKLSIKNRQTYNNTPCNKSKQGLFINFILHTEG